MGSEGTFSAQKRTSGGLPTANAAVNGGARGRAASLLPRGRQIHKTFNNIKITILCGFVTILVLRGTIGLGNLVSSEADAENQHLVEETNRILAEIRSDKDPTDPNDLPEEFLSLNDTYSLGPRISTWDEDRKVWLQKNPQFPSYVNGKPRILLVTGSPPNPCDNAIGDHYLLKALKNKIDYCRIHGIEIVYNMAHLDKELAGYWAKLPLIRRLMLSHPEVEWIWWMDSDALFTDMVFEIPVLKYKDYNMVIHGYPDLLFDQKSWIALNTGSFLFRNCQWSLDLLDAWAPMGPKGPIREEAGKILTANLKGRPAFEADDQSALIYLLVSQKDKWMDKVFVENSFYLHGFWEGLVDRYEEMIEKYHPGLGDERWPFVTHFVGCKPCGSYGDYPVERCLKSMERAFNFADNQVLNLYGFRHRGLVSPNIKRIRNETVTPLVNVDQFDIRHAAHHSSEPQS
ncbi:Galactosyl transferase GMA12/MNN10 family protein [Perilla frutescens var. hirtella]|uniref:xyloglucan 6-xylosyltransferase n=1 Tax=Perilla frutescens var. hirtella TaxID=608512 RepID=A0AAD4JBF5_PERFH|nr:Galactosyl transferase GMA12/MNN10 family protein [Perilla frutescens var. hirtella]KAH6807766.1 Galactosyl transferase GMA12/MNN10 family protein [Perilla frutescens var. frutescens]KAH6830647.1 Galactosyl transferase GMA12/MNN10 family protein [Perilla frutescens var. hirtella]